MKLLVTGADGLVGSAVRRQNPANTTYITRSDADLTDFDVTLSLFQKIQPTHIIHLAAQVGGMGANLNHPGEYFRNNLLINTNVLEAARLVKAEKVLSFLSTCIFPDKCEYPLKEEYLHLGPPHPSNFGYAYAKRMIEVQSRSYRKEWGCNFITSVGTNIYGPNDNFNLENSHVLAALIHKCFLAKKNNTDFVIWGSGKPMREFVLSDDNARLALWAIEHYNEETPIMFSSSTETSIREIVEIISNAMEFKGNIIYDSSKSDGQFRKPSDNSKIRRYLPDFTFTPVPEGVQGTVKWFLEHYPNIRK